MKEPFPAINPVYLTGSLESWNLAELFSVGYRGLELTPACVFRPSSWLEEMEKAGMKPLCVNALPELVPYLTGSLSDAVEWRRAGTVQRLGRVLEWMDEHGIEYMVVAPRRLAENYQSREQARALLVSSLRELASAHSASILLESAPYRLFASSKEIMSIIQDVDRGNVAAALDVGHAMIQGEDPAESAKVLGKSLRYVQVHDVDLRPGVPRLDRHLPLGHGSARSKDVRAMVRRVPWAINITAPRDPVGLARSALEWLHLA